MPKSAWKAKRHTEYSQRKAEKKRQAKAAIQREKHVHGNRVQRIDAR